MSNKVICGLDIGTFKICLTCGKIDRSGKLTILATQALPSRGINHGKIIDQDQLVCCIKELIKKVRQINKLKVCRVYANIDMPNLKTRMFKEKIVFKEKTLITKAHLQRLFNSCIFSQNTPNRKIIYTGWQNFLLDDQVECSSPQGKQARELTINLTAVDVPIPVLKTFLQCIKRAGLTPEALVPSSCAQACVFLNEPKPNPDRNDIIIDVGGAMIKLCVFRNRMLKDLLVLPLGSDEITQDIALKLKLSIESAEYLKTKHLRPDWDQEFLNQKVIVKDRHADRVVPLEQLQKAIASRADCLLQEIKRGLASLNYDSVEVDSVIVCGGGSVLEGFLERLDKILIRPVELGFLSSVKNAKIQAQSPIYATSVGLLYFAQQSANKTKSLARLTSAPIARTVNWTREFYREYF